MLTEFLREAEKRHGRLRTLAPRSTMVGVGTPPDVVARQEGKTQEEAAKAGALHMEGVLGASPQTT